MKIAVLIKYVPEATATWRFADDRTLDRASIDGRLSELDEYAVEQAVRLAEAGVATEITYLTMGPARAVEAVRKALAMGGDRAVHILDDALHGTDAAGTSLVLAAALKQTDADLVICGMASTDAEMSVVPVMVADRLGMPALVDAAEVRVDGDTVTVERDTDDATEEVAAPLPALVTVTDRSGEARYPSFKGIVAAKRKPVTTRSLADLEITAGQVGAAGAATEVRAVRPRPPREAGTVITDEGDAAVRLADFLAANKLL
ncbi:electron transfer flavoprotein subunit beta/FixA family protein [Paractinoplanes brasiliensis]|uniref:Electron transfer flavoprotein subunit beta n=1 Tax=Paractinoplanes brasiliensis TaxID=52695 RepID=A0A4R6JWV2_9ACTN|nr:electron transfer flavoprotein subunit beta/FixA family protein [Actinoplanes brasiliensis]TDO41254.1 electron transfer flavoprotein beta subunit [Actinoplanes brasiliensis]GID27463.1 electron transfer flavoprotein subunit beta [Actinoplanes brasiliensis]